ncbi:MAG: tRNA lysidine(34) synthetase TilS [Actinomycetota bacterium]|nr:tRNA lysidine(34) synthetase TilS [Actinomycetota bacterium]
MTDSVVAPVAEALGDRDCLVALGGGADSAVLLWAAAQALGPGHVRGVFVYHGLEGSTELRTAAVEVAETVGVDCSVIERIVPEGGNLEARSRLLRYEALEAAMKEGEVGVTGHTADDQAETSLMRFLGGSGAGAIGGIPHRRGVWRRPLLGVSRATLRAKAEALGLPFTDDPANENRRFMRTRIRHGVLPALEAELGPGVKSRIRRSASLLSADDAFIERAARRIPVLDGDGCVSIPAAPLTTVPVPVASRVVRRALRILLDGHPGGMADVDAVMSVARGGPAVSISDALQVRLEPPFVTMYGSKSADAPPAIEVVIGGSFRWRDAGYTVSIVEQPPPLIPGGRFTVLDAAVVAGVIVIRGVEPGDRIEIDTGSTPVKEVLRAAGVPARTRAHSLVVAIDGRIAAIGGVRVASWARPRHGEQAMVIEREVVR